MTAQLIVAYALLGGAGIVAYAHWIAHVNY